MTIRIISYKFNLDKICATENYQHKLSLNYIIINL
jgi:hypothetical protein